MSARTGLAALSPPILLAAAGLDRLPIPARGLVPILGRARTPVGGWILAGRPAHVEPATHEALARRPALALRARRAHPPVSAQSDTRGARDLLPVVRPARPTPNGAGWMIRAGPMRPDGRRITVARTIPGGRRTLGARLSRVGALTRDAVTIRGLVGTVLAAPIPAVATRVAVPTLAVATRVAVAIRVAVPTHGVGMMRVAAARVADARTTRATRAAMPPASTRPGPVRRARDAARRTQERRGSRAGFRPATTHAVRGGSLAPLPLCAPIEAQHLRCPRTWTRPTWTPASAGSCARWTRSTPMPLPGTCS